MAWKKIADGIYTFEGKIPSLSEYLESEPEEEILLPEGTTTGKPAEKSKPKSVP